jgi:hypothetical protein
MTVRSSLDRFGALLGVAVFSLSFVAEASAARPGTSALPNAQYGKTVSPDVVNSKTIYDDGDSTSDLYFSPPPTATGFQDYWYLVRGDIVSTTPPPPFNIETVSYFYRGIWNAVAGTVGVWDGGNLVTPVFVGDDNSITVGFNNVTLPTPLTIGSVGIGRFWVGVRHSYYVGSTAIECTTCRTVGLDNVGVNAPAVGFFMNAEANNVNITTATPFGLSRVPIIRAGITANANQVPVELMEFGVR